MERFSTLKVLVIGEAIVDASVRGKAGRLSLEAPAPVVNVEDGQEQPGGAANVAVLARRLGAAVEFVSVVGDDTEGNRLLKMLEEEGVGVEHVVCDQQRQTLLQRRIYAEDRLLLRYDQGSSEPVDEQTETWMLEVMESICPQVDVVILSDYGQGVLTERFLSRLARIQNRFPCVLVADTRRLDAYRGLRLAAVRPSSLSVLELLEPRSNGKHILLEPMSEAGEKLLDTLETELVAITLDDNGALVLERNSPTYRTYAPTQPFNRIPGAGDAFVTALALGLAAGAQAPAAAEIASAMASIIVDQEQQPFCCLDELKSFLSGDQKLFEDWAALGARLEALRRQGKRIVFTNGVFDILHSAHVAYLNQAKSYGDVLVIGVNSDASVKRLKGPTRPVNTLVERCRVLAGLSCVDFVVPFEEDNPINLLHIVRPDEYVKGGDYTRETLPETEVIEGYGGTLRLVPYIANHSTTGVIERIRKLDGVKP